MLATVRVGYAVARPPTPANTRHRLVEVEADTDAEAHLVAAQFVHVVTGAVMPVSTEILEVVL